MKNRLNLYSSQKRPAIVTLGDTGTVLKSRFSSFDGHHVYLDIVPAGQELSSKPGTPVTVVFADNHRHGLFVAPLVNITIEDQPFPRIAVGAPTEIVRGETRRAFRIPLHPRTALAVEVRRDDSLWKPNPVDISVAGILLDFTEESAANFSEEENLSVHLELNDKSVELESFVGRIEQSQVAVYFSETLRELRRGADQIPAVLSSLVNELEREYREKGL